MIEILAATGMFISIIIMLSNAYRDSLRLSNIDKQRAKQMEAVRYHFWLREVGLRETAFMFNEFGITISLGEEV